MSKSNVSKEAAGAPEAQPSPPAPIGSKNGVHRNKDEEHNINKRSSNRNRIGHMSDDASGYTSSSAENLARKRKSRRMPPTDDYEMYSGVSDCSKCRKHKMRGRRSRGRKSRSRSRRRRGSRRR
ncbi:uncharacterized protein LOC129241491 [Anastrepha obliqua]|uniref:uncharacterized protein LOC129241491 n=1 Tax=Anastrepha obliqua TaxID=95512 RepID=UPI00240A40C9|nr:uncharacterized protein LOC129241491 [Anastrepha obliqua]